ENEAQLEYWSRVAHAYFLYYDARRGAWDERGEVYVRYGPPAHAIYNPVGVPLADAKMIGGGVRVLGSASNILLWQYPRLGMTVEMYDRLLTENYMLPISLDRDPDPLPDPDSVATLPDAVVPRGGRGVFPALPPGARALRVARARRVPGRRRNPPASQRARPERRGGLVRPALRSPGGPGQGGADRAQSGGARERARSADGILRDLPSEPGRQRSGPLPVRLHRALGGAGPAHLDPARVRAAPPAPAHLGDPRGGDGGNVAAAVHHRADPVASAGQVPARNPVARP